jgi:hemoglobin
MNDRFADTSRAARISQAITDRTGIDDALIGRLIDEFYARVRADDLLGPIFERRITDWGPHLQRMRDFWSSVALMSGRYHGTPMMAHLPLPVDGAHFDRWLALFETCAEELCPPAAAAHFIERARRIAASLELAIASSRGRMLAKGERYIDPALSSSS